ncbi:hypothetical protein AKJ16_DCAP06743 [Drosera capensis]
MKNPVHPNRARPLPSRFHSHPFPLSHSQQVSVEGTKPPPTIDRSRVPTSDFDCRICDRSRDSVDLRRRIDQFDGSVLVFGIGVVVGLARDLSPSQAEEESEVVS